MAVAGLSWGLPFAIGPYLAGLVMDGPNPRLLWYIAGAIGIVSTLAFLALARSYERKPISEALVDAPLSAEAF
jgi:MFS family permease